jgi:hypothetical protein
MRHKPVQVGITIVVAALAAGGCGETANFVEDYNQATRPLRTLTTEVSTADGKPADVDAGVRRLNRISGRLEAVADRLGALEAPDDAKPLLRRLIVTIDASALRLRGMAKAVRRRDLRRLASERRRFARAGAEMVQAEQALKAAVED